MVSESVMSGACSEFTQNAWKKDLCSNCQRLKGEHTFNVNGTEKEKATSSPVPVKRKSLLINTSVSDNKDVVNVAKRNAALLLSASEKAVSSDFERTSKFVEVSDTNKENKGLGKAIKTALVKKKGRNAKLKEAKVDFIEREPDVIGHDGGYDNLFLDEVDDGEESDSSGEELSFTEEEKEFVMLALENTLWNSEIRNLNGETTKDENRSKEFEDVKLMSMWKIDRFATLRDVDKIIPKRYGTFPLRKPAGGKSKLEKMFHEKADNLQRSNSDKEIKVTEKVESENNQYETNFFTFEKRRSRSASEMEDRIPPSSSSATPYKITSVSDILNPSSAEGPQLPPKTSAQADDKLESSNHLDVFNSLDESVFDLDFDSEFLENFNTDIDLDSSTAGMDLVDLLNDVLARYSDGISIKGFEDQDLKPDGDEMEELGKGIPDAAALVESLRIPKGSIKSKEFEQKLVTLAANLDKRKRKRPAPRPPVSPPPEPGALSKKSSVSTVMTDVESSKSSPNSSPANTLQNPPNFKMVPIGKSILDNQSEKPLSPKRTGDFHEDPVAEVSKSKSENKSNKKGFTSFFKNILRRGKESPENSSEQVADSSMSSLPKVSSSDRLHSDNSSKDKKENGRNSPQLKTKVLPSSNKNSRSSIIMTTAESSVSESQKSDSPKNKRKVLPVVEEKKEILSSSVDVVKTEKGAVEIISAPVKPTVPIRPKPPPNPNKPCISPQMSQKDLSRSSPGKDGSRSAVSKDISRSSPAKDAARASPVKDVLTSTPVQERRNSAELEKKSSLEREKPERTSRSRKTSIEKEAKSATESLPEEREVPVVRRRAKSPKRFTAPPKPIKGVENRNSQFAKELEMRLSKNLDSSKTVMTTAPPSPPVKQEQVKSKEQDTEGKKKTKEQESEVSKSPVQQVKAKVEAKKSTGSEKGDQTSGKQSESKKPNAPDPPSPTSPKLENKTLQQKETKGEKSDPKTMQPKDIKGDKSDSMPSVTEKIELPAKASSRRSFLGKLGNKKSRAPPRPPSGIKRAKSISENSQSGDLQTKRIDVSDISGPVLITPMTGGPVQVTRRNTISIGEDHSMVSGSSTSSGSTADKYDEWPDFSPIGSLENLYEPIVPKEPAPPPPQTSPAEIPATKGHMYDPPGSSTATLMTQSLILPKTPIDGYLEPVRSSNAKSDSTPVPVMQTVVNLEDKVIIPDQEPEISEEKRRIVASQPIYEEINGNGVKVESFIEKENLTVNIPDSMTTSDLQLPVSPTPSHGAMSSESEPSSACSTLSRPKPLPRKRSQRSVSTHSEQPYIAMNRPSITSALNEAQLRDMLNQLTSMNLQTLRDVYTQYEGKFNKEAISLNVSGSGPLKWVDFDIYGKPVHSSERCIVYNAKMKMTTVNCQLMLLHTRPELVSTQHPGLLRPTVVFSDAIPFTYLTDDFIKTSQLLHNLQNSVNQSNFAKCFVAIGQFDITDNLTNHMASLEQSAAVLTLDDHMETVLFCVLQMLSAISHCLDQGFCLGDADFRDIFLLSCGANCHGNIIAFLPHHKSHDQAEFVFNFLEKFLADCVSSCSGSEFGKYFAGVLKIQKMVMSRRLDILSLVRSYIEFLLWGPSDNTWEGGVERQSSLEPKLSMWLEKERAALVHSFAKIAPSGTHKFLVKDFYRMKFLLKSSAVSLSECVRTHISF